jgi:hypothetical protein
VIIRGRAGRRGPTPNEETGLMSNDKLNATGYTPAADPWEALAAHGEPPPPDPDPAVDRLAYRSPGVPPWGSLHQDIGHEPPKERRGLPAWAWVSMVLGVVALLCTGAVTLGLTSESGPVPVVPPAPAPHPAEVTTSGTCEKKIVGQYGLVASVTATNVSGKTQTGFVWARWPVTGEAAQEFTKPATLQPGQHAELTVNQEVTAERWFRVGACSFGWTPDPAAEGVTGELAGWNWTPTTTPVSRRTIEVVDQLKPTKWHVSAAVEWLDRYTASNMKTVSRCSGKAYRCITIRGGKLGGNALAMSYGGRNLIVVDTAKVDRRGYRSDASRKKILAHEVAHQFGLGHSSGRNLMSTSLPRTKLVLTSGQRSHLKKR